MAKPVARNTGCWTGLRGKSFYSCSFLMHFVQIANHEYHPLLLRVPWHILRLPPLDDSCCWNPFFFSIAFFQLENPFFVDAGSALNEVSIGLWSAFNQVWQQAAFPLSSWRNHLNRSNYGVWNDLFLGFLLPKIFEHFSAGMDSLIRLQRLDLEGWVVALSFPVCPLLLWMASNLFQFRLFFGSDCFFDYTRLCVTSAWFHPR